MEGTVNKTDISTEDTLSVKLPLVPVTENVVYYLKIAMK